MVYSKNMLKHRNDFVNSFDSIFDQMLKQTFPDISKEFGIDFFSKNGYPKMNIFTTNSKEKLEVVAEIPGMTREDIKINFNEKDHILTISGEKRDIVDENEQDRIYILKELKKSSFIRTLKINELVDHQNINAKFENGILRIEIPFRTTQTNKEDFQITIQ